MLRNCCNSEVLSRFGLAFSKICDDRGKLGKGRKEKGAGERERGREQTKGCDGDYLAFYLCHCEGGRSRSEGSVSRREENLEKQHGVQMRKMRWVSSKMVSTLLFISY